MVAFPESFLSPLVKKPSGITPTSLALTQHFGALAFTLTAPLVLAIPNTRRGIESRQSVYCTLGAGEVCIISLALYQTYRFDDSGFSLTSLLGTTVTLAPVLLWRLYVLLRKPEWFGRYRDIRKDY
ncbi:hypothetical protein AOQ84DRAFT_384792 [Glonium stellatum]|uniref:Uncharacterized protein n=1 Tax=Glonium stellatum TaxID=574774 RepID=A0A8E2FC90_9PEZI|nr:hypothetical protein AOQ84DRAFT_384792 [Glonium stellatum]